MPANHHYCKTECLIGKPENTCLKFLFQGLPWWSSSEDSMLPLQGAMGSIPGRGIKKPKCCKKSFFKKERFLFHLTSDYISENREFFPMLALWSQDNSKEH